MLPISRVAENLMALGKISTFLFSDPSSPVCLTTAHFGATAWDCQLFQPQAAAGTKNVVQTDDGVSKCVAVNQLPPILAPFRPFRPIITISQYGDTMLLEKAPPVLAFRGIPSTLLALITCLSIFIALNVTDALPNVPQNQGGLNIQQAYEDLRQACSFGSLILDWNLNCCRLLLILILISPIRTMPLGLTSCPGSRR